MSDKAHVTYLFDPLCGWCYGASPLLFAIIRQRMWVATVSWREREVRRVLRERGLDK